LSKTSQIKKRRILRIQSRICIGGPALNTINLSAGLNSDLYQTLLIGGRLQEDEESMEPYAHEKGIAIQIIPEMGRTLSPFDDFRALFKLIRLMKKYKPHLVHTHTAKAGALGRLAAFYCRVPIKVHTFHGHVFKGYFSPLVNRLVITTEQILAKLSSKIITISRIQKQDITEVYRITSTKKCQIVPLGFELDKVIHGSPGNFKKSLKLPESIRLFGILARLVPVKNHHFLLRSIAEWKRLYHSQEKTKIMFLFIGDGTLRNELEQLKDELALNDVVRFTGWKKCTADIYADLDLNMLVSKNEGTPVTLIEGMASGVPILTTDVGGIRDIAPENAGTILSEGASHTEFARAIQFFIRNPKRLSQNVKDKVKLAFGLERLIKDIENTYDELFKSKEIKT